MLYIYIIEINEYWHACIENFVNYILCECMCIYMYVCVSVCTHTRGCVLLHVRCMSLYVITYNTCDIHLDHRSQYHHQ